jgi:hypothetical protein
MIATEHADFRFQTSDFRLLNSQQHLAVAPEFLEVVVGAHVGREEMYDYIAKIQNQPAFARFAFYAALLFEVCFGRLQHAFGEGIEHAVAGAVAKDEIVGKRGNSLDVEEQDVFALFVLQGFDDFMSKFECVQVSPLVLCDAGYCRPCGLSGAEKSLV